jgi:fructokinase
LLFFDYQGALEARSGVSRHNLAELPDDHPLWEASAHALASLCTTLVLIVSPERIILSGGVMNRESLYPRVRELVSPFLSFLFFFVTNFLTRIGRPRPC